MGFTWSGTATAIPTAASSGYHRCAGYGGHYLDDWFRLWDLRTSLKKDQGRSFGRHPMFYPFLIGCHDGKKSILFSKPPFLVGGTQRQFSNTNAMVPMVVSCSLHILYMVFSSLHS